MTLDESLVQHVDRVRKKLRQSRSAFTRDALREHLARHTTAELERLHREGYERHPAASDEFSRWESEQIWGDG